MVDNLEYLNLLKRQFVDNDKKNIPDAFDKGKGEFAISENQRQVKALEIIAEELIDSQRIIADYCNYRLNKTSPTI